jgi:hypothetical protein
MEYRYGADGKRGIKYTYRGSGEEETLYFNRFFRTEYSSSRGGMA